MIRSAVIPYKDVVEDSLYYWFPRIAFAQALQKQGIDPKREFLIYEDNVHYNWVIQQEA